MPAAQRLLHEQHANTRENDHHERDRYREGQCAANHGVPRQKRAARLCSRRVAASNAGSSKGHVASKTFNIMLTCASTRPVYAFSRTPCQHGASEGGARQSRARAGPTVAIAGNAAPPRRGWGHHLMKVEKPRRVLRARVCARTLGGGAAGLWAAASRRPAVPAVALGQAATVASAARPGGAASPFAAHLAHLCSR